MDNIYQGIVHFAQFMVLSQLGIIILLSVNMLLLAAILVTALHIRSFMREIRLEDK